MRWDGLRDAADQAGRPALFEREAATRTFDTPGFRGMTFFEVRSRSIINRVHEASRTPFRWTVNPYRGCGHACAYCVAGPTPILMADGRAKPMADVRVGDEVCGTRLRGARRQRVATTVLAHWETVKPAHRVALADGARLVASGGHRFLTTEGWRHVTGTVDGPGRPHLAPGDRLMGVGDGAAISSRPGLTVASIEPLGLDLPMYDITTGTGDFIADSVVSHNCFARNTHTYLDFDAGHDFDSKIVVKVNAPELLRRELASPRWRGEHVAMGTNVDCYQRAEGRYRLMPGILAALRDAANPFSVLTKGALILRDKDLLAQAAEVTEVGLAVSVGSADRDLCRTLEPGAPSPRSRLAVCAAFADAGLACGVLMGPIAPFLSDSPAQLDAAVRQIAAAGASSVTPIVLHLRPGAREWFLQWLSGHHPALVQRYQALYGRGAYAPKAYQQRIGEQVRELARRHGVGRARRGRSPGPGGRRPSDGAATARGDRARGDRARAAAGTAPAETQLPLL